MDAVVNESNEAQIFKGLNFAVIPVWASMILLPGSRITERIVRWSDGLLAAYAGAYAVQLGMSAASMDGRPDMGDVAAMRRLMAEPAGFLTGWTHFVAFDLFVGRWIWRTAQAEGRSCRMALVLTLMAGPAGFGLFGLQRRSFRSA